MLMSSNVNSLDVDWTVLDEPHVHKVARRAAVKINEKFPNVSEVDDLTQEALILIARHETNRQAARRRDWGYLCHQVEMDLHNHCVTLADRRKRHTSLEELEEKVGGPEGFMLGMVVIETASNDYTRESVQSLLPAVWDQDYAYGMPVKETAPDPDMPRGSVNLARANNLAAYIADIKIGWEKTPLTKKERRALFMAFALGWRQQDIARHEDVHRTTVTHRIDDAIGKIVARMNGGYWSTLEGVEA